MTRPYSPEFSPWRHLTFPCSVVCTTDFVRAATIKTNYSFPVWIFLAPSFFPSLIQWIIAVFLQSALPQIRPQWYPVVRNIMMKMEVFPPYTESYHSWFFSNKNNLIAATGKWLWISSVPRISIIMDIWGRILRVAYLESVFFKICPNSEILKFYIWMNY